MLHLSSQVCHPLLCLQQQHIQVGLTTLHTHNCNESHELVKSYKVQSFCNIALAAGNTLLFNVSSYISSTGLNLWTGSNYNPLKTMKIRREQGWRLQRTAAHSMANTQEKQPLTHKADFCMSLGWCVDTVLTTVTP